MVGLCPDADAHQFPALNFTLSGLCYMNNLDEVKLSIADIHFQAMEEIFAKKKYNMDLASPKAARSTQPFTQSDSRLLEQLTCPAAWTMTWKAAVQAHRLCLATQELSPEGRSRSYSPPGYYRTLREMGRAKREGVKESGQKIVGAEENLLDPIQSSSKANLFQTEQTFRVQLPAHETLLLSPVAPDNSNGPDSSCGTKLPAGSCESRLPSSDCHLQWSQEDPLAPSDFLSSRLPEGPQEHKPLTHQGTGHLQWPQEAEQFPSVEKQIANDILVWDALRPFVSWYQPEACSIFCLEDVSKYFAKKYGNPSIHVAEIVGRVTKDLNWGLQGKKADTQTDATTSSRLLIEKNQLPSKFPYHDLVNLELRGIEDFLFPSFSCNGTSSLSESETVRESPKSQTPEQQVVHERIPTGEKHPSNVKNVEKPLWHTSFQRPMTTGTWEMHFICIKNVGKPYIVPFHREHMKMEKRYQ
ncbi:hypothetical protein GH733_008105 [Mirounga leonina]|nr:hypothetical protein GH733_008105 [Mirounga leonina]